ncbi:MAG: hypothetical protein AABZ34_12105 [Nitrospirota bacterium]
MSSADQVDMAPFTSWLPSPSTQDFDLVVKVAGSGASPLHQDWLPLAHILIDHGLTVMAQHQRLNGHSGDFVLHLRMAVQPFHSMGHGCDVLVHVGDHAPEFWRFDLQPGSVLLWEPPVERPLYPVVPEGVITYPLPLSDLSAPYGEGVSGKGLAALGVLLCLLGCPQETLHRVARLLAAPRSFAAGIEFAHYEIAKRDAYCLPLSADDRGQGRILLAPEQATMLGFAISFCECGTGCDRELLQSPAEWMRRHLGIAGGMVSVLQSERHPDVQVFRGPQEKVVALLGGDDRAIMSCLAGSRILVAADVMDVVKLLIEAHDLIRKGLSGSVVVLVDDVVARRHQSVDLSALIEMVRPRGADVRGAIMTVQSDLPVRPADRDQEAGADVGFFSWGADQGVVRDAVGLCRQFGLNVAGLYPKVVVPLPQAELEMFARTVKRMVLVESSRRHGYAERIRAACSFRPTVLTSLPGKSLTPMDIFLREGLGAV